jgi:uncharacterized protein YkwD
MTQLIIGIFILAVVVIYALYKHGLFGRSIFGLALTERKGSWQLKIINRYRKKQGLRQLRTYYDLDKIARGHSRYMARHHDCNHDGFSDRAKRIERTTGSGYVAENCYEYPARGYNRKVAIKLVRGWMQSPGHRRNSMNPNFHKLGIGIIKRGSYIYATQIFSS